MNREAQIWTHRLLEVDIKVFINDVAVSPQPWVHPVEPHILQAVQTVNIMAVPPQFCLCTSISAAALLGHYSRFN
jgi:hypothetical protein